MGLLVALCSQWGLVLMSHVASSSPVMVLLPRGWFLSAVAVLGLGLVVVAVVVFAALLRNPPSAARSSTRHFYRARRRQLLFPLLLRDLFRARRRHLVFCCELLQFRSRRSWVASLAEFGAPLAHELFPTSPAGTGCIAPRRVVVLPADDW